MNIKKVHVYTQCKSFDFMSVIPEVQLYNNHHAVIYYRLVIPCGDRGTGQQEPKLWLVAWQHQSESWTSAEKGFSASFAVIFRDYQFFSQGPVN